MDGKLPQLRDGFVRSRSWDDQSRAAAEAAWQRLVDEGRTGGGHRVAAVEFGHWRYKCYDAVANLPDKWRILDRQPVRQFHQHLG